MAEWPKYIQFLTKEKIIVINIFERNEELFRIEIYQAYSPDWNDTEPKFYFSKVGIDIVHRLEVDYENNKNCLNEACCKKIEQVYGMKWMGKVV